MMKTTTITLLTTLLIAGGCSTVDPYTREQKTAGSSKGSVIGAVAGAAIGAATSSKKDRKKGIITGIAAGAALGGGIGYYMDVQEAKLRERLENSEIMINRVGNSIILNMPNSITFATDSSVLKSAAVNSIDDVSSVLKEFDKTSVLITGYTDSSGQAGYNQLLSEKRAQSVANQLTNAGITYNRLEVLGKGVLNPLNDNSTKEKRAQNRRVEITLLAPPK